MEEELATTEHPHLSRRAQISVLRSDRQISHVVAESLGDFVRPGLEFLACPFEAMVLVTQFFGRQSFEVDVVFAVGVVSTTSLGLACSNNTLSNAANLGGSRCSMTSITVAASKSASRWSRYINEPWMSLIRSSCRGASRSSFSRLVAISNARWETSSPTISVNFLFFSISRSKRPIRRSPGR